MQQLMVEQEKALDGKSGSILLTVDKQSGKILSGHRMSNCAGVGRYGRRLWQSLHRHHRRDALLCRRRRRGA